MASVFNAYLAYKFIKILTTDWKDQDAHQTGVIDADGNSLKTTKQLKTRLEKDSFTTFHKIIFNIKRILSRFPGGKSRIASYAAALALLKENNENLKRSDIDMLEGLLIEYINLQEDEHRDSMLLNEEIANTAGPAALGNFNADPFTPKRFAGMPIFKVPSDSYNKFLRGKKKYSRWEPFLRREEAAELRTYIKRYPSNKVVLQDAHYGTMVIMQRDL
tara:strand:- start:142 stop:795 length:654 start_codon:yes stop_codon:yes gene_type:complete